MRQSTFCIPFLVKAGISEPDAVQLRRIAMTLHRWHELECGDSNNYASWCIVRGRRISSRVQTEQGLNVRSDSFTHADDGAPYTETHWHNENKPRYTRLADRERGALKRLAKIMAQYPQLSFYVQGDPRGCALYILRPGDVPEGETPDGYYSRGLAVYQ